MRRFFTEMAKQFRAAVITQGDQKYGSFLHAGTWIAFEALEA